MFSSYLSIFYDLYDHRGCTILYFVSDIFSFLLLKKRILPYRKVYEIVSGETGTNQWISYLFHRISTEVTD